jgi:cytochrome c-type biogenesis protein CcmH
MTRGLLLFAAGVLFSLALAAPALASEQHPTQAELEREIICPVCSPETLAQSSSPIAERMRAFIRERIAAGDTKSEIKAKLVANFGEGVLAAPPKEGFNLLAWVLPLAGGAAAVIALAFAVRRWARDRPAPAAAPVDPAANGRAPLDPELERRLDEELARFDA